MNKHIASGFYTCTKQRCCYSCVMFTLDPRLDADSTFVKDLALCQVRLSNDALYPWLILVPRQVGLREMIDLSPDAQLILMQEISHVTQILKSLTNAEKMNVAALGNVVAQLHIHIIARFEQDAAWPAPIWGKHPAKAYSNRDFLNRLKAVL